MNSPCSRRARTYGCTTTPPSELWTSWGPPFSPDGEGGTSSEGVKMKLGKLLSVGEVVEDSVAEEMSVAEPSSTATAADSVAEGTDSVTEGMDGNPAPKPVAISGDR
jgi:hypothetical protein